MSEEIVQSFKKMFEEKIDINVKNKWFSSKYLKIDCCPEVIFNISIQRITDYIFNVKVTKFFTKPATALIELTINSQIRRQYITNWTDDVIFENFSLSFDNDVRPQKEGFLNNYRYQSRIRTYRVTISGDITWYGFNDDLLNAKMNKNMETYLKNVEFSDVKIRVKNNEEFPAHKVFLASSSSVFKKMLTTDMKESRDKCINLPELDSDTVNELLHFLYYGKLDKASDNGAILFELVKAADMYLISDLKRVCDVLLSRLLTSENVISLLEISGTYKLPIVRQQSLIFIANHVDVLFEEEI
ncbi:uncharacterized protein LOC123269525 [Cotesia glomerata]|uniref:uncharacterized protein LOC123269525 n=1 Tax=Cotesia glomerata TaxID=32391 RepID=UPI001D012B8E|nr:uncharacterized protein LOC123269525 [Cotesia glomerata]